MEKETTKNIGVIVYLTQNTEVRKTYLKTSLYFLFQNFNDKFRYPVYICHEGDFDEQTKEEILVGIRGECKQLIKFILLDKEDFELPNNIDKEYLNKLLSLKPTPYWRSDKYRMMCRWWMRHVYKYVGEFDYVMRLDDDSFIEEPIEKDIFKTMKEGDFIYASNFIQTDCGICNFGMKELFENLFPTSNKIKDLFKPSQIPWNPFDNTIGKIIEYLTITAPEKAEKFKEKGMLENYMPVMFYNNFFVTKVSFWKQKDVQEVLDKVDENKGIFYYRWGDSPLQSVIVGLMAPPNKIKKFTFKYSKRMQREAFFGDDKKWHAYMPQQYKKVPCISQQ